MTDSIPPNQTDLELLRQQVITLTRVVAVLNKNLRNLNAGLLGETSSGPDDAIGQLGHNVADVCADAEGILEDLISNISVMTDG